MLGYQLNAMECGVCLANVDITMTRAVCDVCKDRTCVNCQRTCDKCLKLVCMKDVALTEFWSDNVRNMLRMCNSCQKGASMSARLAS